MKFVTFTLVLMMSLMGCAQKKDAGQKKGIRPFNIAKKVEVDRVVPVILDERPLLATVTDLTAEPMQDGVILRATGLADTAQWWNVSLVTEAAPKGELRYSFRAMPPKADMIGWPAGSVTARQVTAAVFIPLARLQNGTHVIITARDNARSYSPNF